MKTKHLLASILLLTSLIFKAQVPTSERDALIMFFNSTGGADWNNYGGWLTGLPVSNWYGIETQVYNGEEHVIGIQITNNNMIGTLTPEIGNLPFLQWLILDHNDLSGTIPVEIGNLTNLHKLHVRHNSFSGTLPTELGDLPNLDELFLSFNQFSGGIGNWVDNLTQLTGLLINNNQFGGVIDLSQNNLIDFVAFSNTQISAINFKNGNNTNVSDFEAENMPNLNCIVVDDANYSSANWNYVDAQVNFVETTGECTPLSVKEEKGFLSATIFPNPTNGFTQIKTEKPLRSIIVYSSMGRVVSKQYYPNNSIDLSKMENGVYFIKIETLSGENNTFPVVKE